MSIWKKNGLNEADRQRRPEAIPELIEALGDGMGETLADEALMKIGEAARGPLMQAAVPPLPSEYYEDRSSLARRRSALRLLSKT